MLHCLRRGSIVSIVCVIAAMSVPSLTFACQSEWTQGIIKSELVFERAPFKSCHASTIAETPSGLVVAFFAGTREGSADVSIWVSRFIRGTWTPPKEVANGIQSGGEREPCWNPVLFQIPGGRLLLFYKVGPSPSEWWGMMARSTDGGATWSDPQRLPDGILGPIKNKPILLANGVLLAPSSTEHGNWNVHVESTRDEAVTWQRTASIPTDGVMNVIQPTIVTHRDGRLQMLCRSRENFIAESWSVDSGASWSPLMRTPLPNPNSGIDAVSLHDRSIFLVYNHTQHADSERNGPRSPLNVATSVNGKDWRAVAVLENEPGEFSYPAVIETSDHLVHIVYTWKRIAVKHVVIDPSKCTTRAIINGRWPD